MPLPLIVMPTSLGRWMADGYSTELKPLHASTPMCAGADRKRRIFTLAPRVVTATLEYSGAQANLFDRWYEDGLVAGTLKFSAQVGSLDGGLEWWECRFLSPPELDPLPRGYWRAEAQLALTGEPSATPPTDCPIEATIVMHLQSRARLGGTRALTLDISMDLAAAAHN